MTGRSPGYATMRTGDVEVPRHLRYFCNLSPDAVAGSDRLRAMEQTDVVLLEPNTTLDVFFGPYVLHRSNILTGFLDTLSAASDELREAAVVVGHPEGRVLGVQQLPCGGHDRLQHVADLEVPAHGEEGGTHRGEPRRGQGAGGHGLTVPAGRPGRIGLGTGTGPGRRTSVPRRTITARPGRRGGSGRPQTADALCRGAHER